MNRKRLCTKFQPHLYEMISVDDQNNYDTLNGEEEKKCRQKFDAYKPEGCSKISKLEIKKMLKEHGIEVCEEELLKMLWEADPKGQGFLDFDSFSNMVKTYKKVKYDEVSTFIGLTFDSVLEEQRIKHNDPTCEEVTWDFLKYYLRHNFELEIGVHNLIGKNKSEKPLGRSQFMNIFS